MTLWQEFKQIWTTDGWGQPRTVPSKIALCFYVFGLSFVVAALFVYFEAIVPVYEKITGKKAWYPK